MVFQDPLSTLNPAFSVGEQIRESLRIHGICPSDSSSPNPAGAFMLRRARLTAEQARVLHLMAEVGIASPTDRYREYPHQFSGGCSSAPSSPLPWPASLSCSSPTSRPHPGRDDSGTDHGPAAADQ